MTLRAKLYAGLLALLAMSVATSGIMWWGIDQVVANQRRIGKAHQPVEALLALSKSVNEFLARASGAAVRPQGWPDVATARDQVDLRRNALVRIVLGGPAAGDAPAQGRRKEDEIARLERLIGGVSVVMRLVERAHALAIMGQQEQSSELVTTAQHVFDEEVVAAMNEWIRLDLGDIQATEERAAGIAAQISRVALVVPVASAALVVLVFGLFLPRLRHQLRSIGQATEELAQGKLDTRLPDLGKDELGQLAHAFNHMAAELSAMTRRLEETREQLVQAQKMEAIGRLAGGIAHDFNNILVVVLANCDILRDEKELPPAWQGGIEEITHAAERAASLIRRLLAFSRQRAFEPRVVRVNDVILDMSAMLRRLLRTDVELVVLTADDLWLTRLDRSNLEQVLLNLVVNARDAMPEGGKIVIETANGTIEDDASGPGADGVPAGEYVAISVTDTGSGMTAEVKEHIFEPFFTTKDAGQGTGLGLATCYGLVTQVGGHIRLDTEPGRGTTFRIYLPRTVDAEEEVQPGPETHPNLRGTETILVVEDEPTVRVAMATALERLGYNTLAADNGAAALRAIGAHGPGAVDLVLADMVMPEMNGIELARRIKEIYPALRILLVSGYAGPTILTREALHLSNGFLQKPFRTHDLAAAVRKALSGGRASSNPGYF